MKKRKKKSQKKGPPFALEKDLPAQPDVDPDPTKKEKPEKIDPTRIEEPGETDPTRITPEPKKRKIKNHRTCQ